MKPGEAEVRTTLDGSTNYGSQMLPQKTANEVIMRVWNESFFRKSTRAITMDTEVQTIPKIVSGVTMYGTTGNKNTEPTETRHTTGEITLTQKTIIGNHPIDRKTLAYAITRMFGALKDDLVDTVIDTEEDVFINGDTTSGSSNINGEYHATNYPRGIITQDPRLEMNGMRKWASDSGNSVNCSGATLALSHIRQALSKLGLYGKKTEDLILLVSVSVATDILGYDELETLEKYGPKATIFRGEIGRIYGIRVVKSSLVPDTCGATGVARTQAGGDTENNRSIALLYNKKSPIIGNPAKAQRKFTLEVETEPKKDQIVLIPSWDMALANQYSGAFCQIINILPP